MGKLFVCLIVLGAAALNNVNSISPFKTIIANLEAMERIVANRSPAVQERAVAQYLNFMASLYPMARDDWSRQNDPSMEDSRTNRRNSLGLDRPGVRQSTEYPWNIFRRGYVPRKDTERFPISLELKERKSRIPENMFSEIEAS